MSCVVARPGLIVTDSLDTGTIKRSAPKAFKRNGYLIGCAGESAPLNILEHSITWPNYPTIEYLTTFVYEYHDVDALDFGRVELVVATASTVFVLDDSAWYESAEAAIGSGAAYALGYLRAKPKDFTGAVEAACAYDPYCAGPVRELKL